MTRRKGGLADRGIKPKLLLLLPGERSMIAYKINANKYHMYMLLKSIIRMVEEVSYVTWHLTYLRRPGCRTPTLTSRGPTRVLRPPPARPLRCPYIKQRTRSSFASLTIVKHNKDSPFNFLHDNLVRVEASYDTSVPITLVAYPLGNNLTFLVNVTLILRISGVQIVTPKLNTNKKGKNKVGKTANFISAFAKCYCAMYYKGTMGHLS